jgi:hypothetical protein
MVAQACNPSYWGDGDWEDCSSRPAWAETRQIPCQPIKLGMVVCTFHPAMSGSLKQEAHGLG